jgi:hypothetical protein
MGPLGPGLRRQLYTPRLSYHPPHGPTAAPGVPPTRRPDAATGVTDVAESFRSAGVL